MGKHLLFAVSLVSGIIIISFQNCSDVDLNHPVYESASCSPVIYGIKTDNTSADNVTFSIMEIDNLIEIADQNFHWTLSENGNELQSSDSPKLEVEKSSLVACHTYQIQTSYMDCDGEVTLNVDYTLDGDSCTTPTPTPTPTPPLYPPPDPAPPGQQTVGMGCSNGYGNNANFDYAHGRYCAADSNSTNELMSCRNGGFDFSSSNIKYYPLIKPGKYLAIEVELPHPFTNGINKTVCGLHVAGEIGNSCGGSGGGAIESWTISTSPGDFNVADPRCATFSTTSSLTGRVLTSPEISGCPMDRGRKYYVNIKMGDNCTAPGGCSFLLQISGLFSGSTYNIGGQPRTLDTSCQFAP